MEDTDKKELFTALNKVIEDLKIITKNADGYSKIRYADMAQIVRSISDPLLKHGLSISHSVRCEGDNYFVVSKLAHTTGQNITSEIPLLMPKRDMQGLGAAISYARRYNCMALLNLGISDKSDDDGDSIKAIEFITADQKDELESLLVDYPKVRSEYLKHIGLQDFLQIEKSTFASHKKTLADHLKKLEAKNGK